MKLQANRMAICFAVVAIGCNPSTPESVIQKSKHTKVVTSDLVFNVEGLT